MGLHKKSGGSARRYQAFGEFLRALRAQSGIAQQSDLASLLKTTQQTVSRWEAGISRPRDKQIPMLASALGANAKDLLVAAGYAGRTVVTSYDQPFPLEALSADSFERFCYHFLQLLHPAGKVHREGGTGHTQGGVDIEVRPPDGTVLTYQCKRVASFGPEKVHAAVAKHTLKAKEKTILLARIASPQAREAVRQHAGWEIWDKEDISMRVRTKLSREDQRTLVDTFFPRQRLALLGEQEVGPWQSPKQFFAPFQQKTHLFNHAWRLVGRQTEVDTIVAALANAMTSVVLLVGPGGAGKTRVLKQAVEAYKSEHKDAHVWFLAQSEPPTRMSLEDLGAGRKVLVVDDAHERDDLQPLFHHVSAHPETTKLILSLRPYGLDRISDQAGRYALSVENRLQVPLHALGSSDTVALAMQVLDQLKGPTSFAAAIAHATTDCALTTVIGARIVASRRLHPALLTSEAEFRAEIFRVFRDVFTGEIGTPRDAEPIQRLLRVLALMQPVYLGAQSFTETVGRVEGLDAVVVSRLTRLLTGAGVLFKRGSTYRLSPDLLADFIIEESCIRPDGTSTGYAEKVFEAAGDAHIRSLLLNVSRLDWRLSRGGPSESPFLDDIWAKLEPSESSSDAHVAAVAAVAYYQPRRAIEFAERLIRQGHHFRDLPQVLRNAAYNLDQLPHACARLWMLGKADDRDLGQHPDHAIRILSDLCAFERGKHPRYTDVAVQFALSLLEREDSWTHRYTPFDLLRGALRTEGSDSSSDGRSITFKPFYVYPDAAKFLRAKVISAAIALLARSNGRIAVQAAHFLEDSLRYPIGLFGAAIPPQVHDAWTDEFVTTLTEIEQAVQAHDLDAVVLIQLFRSVSWHARFGRGLAATIAQRVLESAPCTLQFRTIRWLVDGFGQLREGPDIQSWRTEWERAIDSMAAELAKIYSEGEQLRQFIATLLTHIETVCIPGTASPYVLYRQLLAKSMSLAQATVADARDNAESATKQFMADALLCLLDGHQASGLAAVGELLATGRPDLKIAVAQAFGRFRPTRDGWSDESLATLRELLGSRDETVVVAAVPSTRTIAKTNHRLAIELVKLVDIGLSDKVADEVLGLFVQGNDGIPFEALTAEDVAHFLSRLEPLGQLDGYWLETFLSRCSRSHSFITAAFFTERVEKAAAISDWQYRPCNYGPYSNVRLAFRESSNADSLLRQTVRWIRAHDANDHTFFAHASQLFAAMFGPFDVALIGFLQEWLDAAEETEIRMIARLLSEAPAETLLANQSFVVRLLDKASLCGEDALDEARNAVFAAAVSGTRSGTVGEPFPEDLRLKERAERALRDVPRSSAAYGMYEALRRHAEQDIKRSRAESEAIDDGDDQ